MSYMTESSSENEFDGSARRRRRKESVRETKYSRMDWEGESTSSEETSKRGSSVEYVVEEEVAAVECVMEERMGLVGATGDGTTYYNCMFEGDPNEGEGEKERQYLIKWKGLSYMHATWETESSLRNVKGLQRLKNFKRKARERERQRNSSDLETLEYMEYEEEMRVELLKEFGKLERIICEVPEEYLCKWCGLAYGECTYELRSLIEKLFPEVVEEYIERKNCMRVPSSLCRVLMQRPRFVRLCSQPSCLSSKKKLELRDYQLEGVNWLLFGWCRNLGGILADEMGLGKTIQVISFLNYLFNTYSVHGPFMIVVPLSTIEAWKRELMNWSPEMNTIAYIGDIYSREKIREYEWWLNTRIKFNVLLTTYEILLKDDTHLCDINWACLVVDEAHRLKNDESILYKTLISYNTNHRILMSGTPLQNTLRELWSLLAFLNPYNYCDWPLFQARHTNNNYERLHDELKPILLRRMKHDVEKSLPAKVERILRIELSALQKQYYKWIITRNFSELTKGCKKRSFLNIMMELQKCCNHAFLVKYADNPDLQNLIRGSGKFILLDKLLTRLKENGHRVLIFSQMVRILDLLSRYMILKGFQFQRLDGTIRGEVRKQAMDHFNADNSNDFCFLLSTRAGGLGLNLATADTVIIFDSDWNPQNDLQAQARAHRIGQTKQVTIYRLVSKDTIEQSIIERAKKKMVLDHLVIQRMDTSGKALLTNSTDSTKLYSKEDLSAIIAFGAENLFKEKEGHEQEPNVDIDEILNLAEHTQPHSNNTLLSQFKVVDFTYTEDEHKSWEDIVPLSYRNKVFEPPAQRVKSIDPDYSDKRHLLNKTEMIRFVRSFKKFTDPFERIPDIMADASLTVSLPALKRLAYDMYRRCCDTYRQSNKKTPVFIKMCSAQVNAKLLLESVDMLQPLTKLSSFDSQTKDRLMAKFTKVKHLLGTRWTSQHDWHMLEGIVQYGFRNWQIMRQDSHFADLICPHSDSKTPYKAYLLRAEQLFKIVKDYDESDDEIDARNQLTQEVFAECKDNLRSHKLKLKSLRGFTPQLPSEDDIVQNLREIGDHIKSVVLEAHPEDTEEWKSNYWTFVSLFTSVSPSELEKHYSSM